MVNSWNIKDPIQYKTDLTISHEPEFWQWIPDGQIIYSDCGRSRYLIDNEVVKTFTQDQKRIEVNNKNGNMNSNAKKRVKGQWS
jgi:hypothetical protein